jgi:trypsin-like peptidase
VVAGVRGGPNVYVMGGASYRAKVVVYDPRRDIAVLSVPGLNQRPLSFNPSAKTRDNAVVAGFPRGHPGFVAVAARIRIRQYAKGPDIYHAGQVKREIYAIRGIVEPGNSGGRAGRQRRHQRRYGRVHPVLLRLIRWCRAGSGSRIGNASRYSCPLVFAWLRGVVKIGRQSAHGLWAYSKCDCEGARDVVPANARS